MTLRILANDGIDDAGKNMFEEAGFIVSTENISQEDLINEIINFDVLLVRSATKVTQQVMDAGNLKVIGRAGVGMDNIDLVYAKEKGIAVYNTPSASSTSVGELVFAHLLGLCRNLPVSNRIMPTQGDVKFKDLKKAASDGSELLGKTIGIIGFGRIGQESARIAIGCGMRVVAHDPFVKEATVKVGFHSDMSTDTIDVHIKTVELTDLLTQADFITLHMPGLDKPVLSTAEFASMKPGVGIVNCARGGVVDEKALLVALNLGKVKFAGIDVFEKEPPVFMDILAHPHVSLSPHIGASTAEAQERVGIELATSVINHFSN
jgi:D-3-phosphoglycerate dehydrogenase